jgi:hypothetical protein
MRDIVGLNLSVMVGLADGAADLAAHRDERSAGALRGMGDSGLQAVGETTPRPQRTARGAGGKGAPQLAAQGSVTWPPLGAGLTVTYRTAGDLDSPGSGVQLAIHRIAQEAPNQHVQARGQRLHRRGSDRSHACQRRAPRDKAAEPEAAVTRSAATSAMSGPPRPGCGPSVHG